MREKYYFIVSIVLSMLVLSGCSNEEKYSEEETTIIADYVAQTVIKHSEGYEGKLVDISDNPFLLTKEDSFVDSLRDGASQDKVEDVEEIDKTEPTTKVEDDSSLDNTLSLDNKTEDKESVKNISSILGFQDGIEAYVSKYELLKEYASSSYVIDVNDDEVLIKIEFEIKNITSKDINVQVNSVDSKFRLVIADDTYEPLITAVENDFMFFDKKIKSNSSQKAVLLFSVPKNIGKEEMSLDVKCSSTSALVSLDK